MLSDLILSLFIDCSRRRRGLANPVHSNGRNLSELYHYDLFEGIDGLLSDRLSGIGELLSDLLPEFRELLFDVLFEIFLDHLAHVVLEIFHLFFPLSSGDDVRDEQGGSKCSVLDNVHVIEELCDGWMLSAWM
jgi:hypothetical protein